MSHVVTLKMAIKNKKACQAAFERLGGTWHEGCTTYIQYPGHVGDYPLPAGFAVADMGKCHHMVSFPKIHYQVGIVEVDKLPEGHKARTVKDAEGKLVYPPGSLVPIFDFIDYDLKKVMGGVEIRKGEMEAQKFAQAYALELGRQKMITKGYRKFKEITDEKGTVKLECEK